jgi:hypothetical protein
MQSLCAPRAPGPAFSRATSLGALPGSACAPLTAAAARLPFSQPLAAALAAALAPAASTALAASPAATSPPAAASTAAAAAATSQVPPPPARPPACLPARLSVCLPSRWPQLLLGGRRAARQLQAS